ncbi:MAG: hypothetical protein KBB86_01190 [Candidatus Pacebacteria bacterium]|nr:hypothetical protein [Candidatus Paceibacterota bacterium]
MSTAKKEAAMIIARMRVAQKTLNSGIQKRDNGEKEVLEAQEMIESIQAECPHPTDKLIELGSHDAKKCGICGKSIE